MHMHEHEFMCVCVCVHEFVCKCMYFHLDNYGSSNMQKFLLCSIKNKKEHNDSFKTWMYDKILSNCSLSAHHFHLSVVKKYFTFSRRTMFFNDDIL